MTNATSPGHPRVLVIRTSRFVSTAVSEVRRQWPAATLRVLHQAGSERELVDCGVEPEGSLRLPATSRLDVWSAIASRPFWRLLWWRPDHVVLQWWNPDGIGHEAADRAALLLNVAGFHVVLEDGSRFFVSMAKTLRRTFARWLRGALLVTAGGAAVVLATPGWWIARRRERRRMKGRG